jgi:hypothetical protein
MQTAVGNVTRVIAQVQERVQRRISNEINIAATTTIATRWTTAGHKLLTPEGSNSVTSVTALYVNLCPVNEHLEHQ